MSFEFPEDEMRRMGATTEILPHETSANKREVVAETEVPSVRKYESPPEVRNPKEDVLVSRDKTSSKKIGRGITDSSFIELKDDGKGIFKTEGCFNERAAYLIDRFLGFNLVPPTVIRQVDGDIGSVQEFIPDTKMADELEDSGWWSYKKRCHDELAKMWIFDMIINNKDRHPGNFLVKDKKKIYAIDHGRSLGYSKGSFEHIDFEEGWHTFFDEQLPRDTKESLKKFLEKQTEQKILEDLLSELYDREKAVAILKRIKYFAKLISANGEIPPTERGVIKISEL